MPPSLTFVDSPFFKIDPEYFSFSLGQTSIFKQRYRTLFMDGWWIEKMCHLLTIFTDRTERGISGRPSPLPQVISHSGAGRGPPSLPPTLSFSSPSPSLQPLLWIPQHWATKVISFGGPSSRMTERCTAGLPPSLPRRHLFV